MGAERRSWARGRLPPRRVRRGGPRADRRRRSLQPGDHRPARRGASRTCSSSATAGSATSRPPDASTGPGSRRWPAARRTRPSALSPRRFPVRGRGGCTGPARPWGDEDLGRRRSRYPADADRGRVGHGSFGRSTLAGGPGRHTRGPGGRAHDRGGGDRGPVPAAARPGSGTAYERLDAARAGADGRGGGARGRPRALRPGGGLPGLLLEDLSSFGGTSVGGLLAPLRVLTFWQMKRRARDVGAGGRGCSAACRTRHRSRFHLMGHSFGCIVVSRLWRRRARGNAAGGLGVARPGRHVAVVLLLRHPLPPRVAGLLPPRADDGLVDGPVVVTTSVHDRAVRTFYPLGRRGARSGRLRPDRLPTYGAIGTFGLRGPGVQVWTRTCTRSTRRTPSGPAVCTTCEGTTSSTSAAG